MYYPAVGEMADGAWWDMVEGHATQPLPNIPQNAFQLELLPPVQPDLFADVTSVSDLKQ